MGFLAGKRFLITGILAGQRYVKFNVDSILRSDLKTRYESYAIAQTINTAAAAQGNPLADIAATRRIDGVSLAGRWLAPLGLDRPVPVQYALFLKRLVIDRSLGTSFTNRRNVTQTILDAAPVTASLVFGGAILWLLVSIPIGVLSALYLEEYAPRNRWTDLIEVSRSA